MPFQTIIVLLTVYFGLVNGEQNVTYTLFVRLFDNTSLPDTAKLDVLRKVTDDYAVQFGSRISSMYLVPQDPIVLSKPSCVLGRYWNAAGTLVLPFGSFAYQNTVALEGLHGSNSLLVLAQAYLAAMAKRGVPVSWLYIERMSIEVYDNIVGNHTDQYKIWFRLEGTNLLDCPLCHSTQICWTVQNLFPFVPATFNITQMAIVDRKAEAGSSGRRLISGMQYGAMEPISQFQAAEGPAADSMAVDVQLELQTTDGKASPELLRKFFSDPVTSAAWLASLQLQINSADRGTEVQRCTLLNVTTYHGIYEPKWGSTTSYSGKDLLPNTSSPPPPIIIASVGDSGLSLGALVGIIVGAVLVVFCAVGLAAWIGRRRRLGVCCCSKPYSEEYYEEDSFQNLSEKDIEICKRPDGSDWLLGEGAYGRVYRGKVRGVDVAVKVLQRKMAEGVRCYLEHEVRILRMTEMSAHVVRLCGAFIGGPETNRPPMLVMELMAGDLCETIGRDVGDKYAWYNDGARVAVDIARGIAFLHSMKIVHRDLKASNILMSASGRAKIGDCGLAKVMEESLISASGAPAGTFAYAAPEVLMGERYSEKADIYSFGVLLWQIISRNRPQRGKLYPLDVPEQCPQAVDDLITACLLPVPSTRPSAEEIIGKLIHAQDSGSSKSDSSNITVDSSDLGRKSAEGSAVVGCEV